MAVIGLVVEGTHDYLMLEPFLRRELQAKFGQAVTFRELQPLQDATGSYSGGGWARVVSWCLANQGANLSTYFTALFAGQAPCDAIVIHLDGDALEDVAKSLGMQPKKKVKDVGDRVARCVKLLEAALQAGTNRGKLAMAVPVMQTEAWMLSAEGVALNYEVIEAKTYFRASFVKGIHGNMYAFYKARATVLLASMSQNLDGLISYQMFQAEVAAL